MIQFWIIAILVVLFTPKVWANDAISDIGNEWESRIGRDTQPQQGSAPTLCFQKGAGMISCFEQRKAATSGGKYCLYKSATSGAFAASCNPSGDLNNKGDATGGKQDSSSSNSSGSNSSGSSSSGSSSSGSNSGGNSSGGNSSGGSVSVVGGGGSSSAGGGSAAGTSSSSSSSSSSTERRETPESVRKAYEAWQKKWQDEFKRLERIAVSIKEALADKLHWCIAAYGGGTPNQITCSNNAIADAENKLNKLKEQIAKAEAQAAKELAELNKQYNVSGNVGSPTPPTVIVDGGSSSSNSNSSNSNNGSDASNSNNQSSGNNNGDGGTTYITNNTTNNHTTHHNTTNNTNNYTTDSAETNGLLATISGKMGELGTAIKELAGKVKELATNSGNKDSGSHNSNSSDNNGNSGVTPTPDNGNTGNAASNTNGIGIDDGKDNSGKEEPKEEQPKDVKFDSNNDDLDGKAPTKDLGGFDVKGYFASSGTCPPPYSVNLGFLGQWQLSYDWFCKVANAMRGVVIGFAWLAGLMIIVKGTRRA